MRVLVISDVHSNIIALEAVLEHAGAVDAVWCLGDVVGYGPNPNECVQKLRDQANLVCLTGNHDAAAIGKLDTRTFNPEARMAVRWTEDNLEPETRLFLDACPEMTVEGEATLVHASPREPISEYILDTLAATENFDFFDTSYCFIGHSHIPLMFHLGEDDHMAKLSVPALNAGVYLRPRTIINPGSVGQPRDRDPRSSYAIYYPEKHVWENHRVSYDVAVVQQRMRLANLPHRHIERLSAGW